MRPATKSTPVVASVRLRGARAGVAVWVRLSTVPSVSKPNALPRLWTGKAVPISMLPIPVAARTAWGIVAVSGTWMVCGAAWFVVGVLACPPTTGRFFRTGTWAITVVTGAASGSATADSVACSACSTGSCTGRWMGGGVVVTVARTGTESWLTTVEPAAELIWKSSAAVVTLSPIPFAESPTPMAASRISTSRSEDSMYVALSRPSRTFCSEPPFRNSLVFPYIWAGSARAAVVAVNAPLDLP